MKRSVKPFLEIVITLSCSFRKFFEDRIKIGSYFYGICWIFCQSFHQFIRTVCIMFDDSPVIQFAVFHKIIPFLANLSAFSKVLIIWYSKDFFRYMLKVQKYFHPKYFSQRFWFLHACVLLQYWERVDWLFHYFEIVNAVSKIEHSWNSTSLFSGK